MVYSRLLYYAELSFISILFFALIALLATLTLAFMLSDEIFSYHPLFKILQMAKDFLRLRWRTFLIVLTLIVTYAAGLTFFSLILSGPILIFFSLIVACSIAINATGNIYKRRDEILSLVSVGLNPDHLALLVLAQFMIIGFFGGGLGYSIGIYLLILSRLPVSIVRMNLSAGLMATVIMATTTIMLLASLLPAIKISMLATPSIKKKWWKGEPVFVGWPPTLSFRVPVKVTDKNVEKFFDNFMNYIMSLKHSADDSIERIENIRVVAPKGERPSLLKFNYIYNEMGSPSLTTENEIKIWRERASEKFTVEITIKVLKHRGFGQSIYGFLEKVASAYRKAAFESVASYKVEYGRDKVDRGKPLLLF